MMKKSISLVVAIVLSLVMFAGCSQGQQSLSEAPASPSEAAQPSEAEPEPQAGPEPESEPEQAGPGGREGVLIVGLDDTFAPMGFRDEAGELVGFDIDLAKAVGEEMSWEIKFQPISWDAKEMELAAKNIDCIWNGMSRTPEREAMWTLSQNYLNNKLAIMTVSGVEITSLDQLADYQIGTQAKSAALEAVIAHEIYPAIQGNIQEYPTYDEVILDMQAGRIDVMLVDEVLGQYKNANLNAKFNVASVDFGDDFYCIGFRKEDTELCGKVEEAIKAVAASGKGEEISQKWFGENLLLEMQ